MPRMTPPLHVNEDDLDRGPLNCVLLLQPFNLLPVASKANIVIVGGPLNDLWWNSAFLQRWAEQYARQLETWTPRRIKHVKAIPQHRRLLKERGSIVWDLVPYGKLCRAIMEDFSNTSLDVDGEMPTTQRLADP
ncbi:hypothetical protein AYL99_03414 [Fonsecaea erecta]|uniref:Uncharacterized protein n=1 Tax=Fonsecaea erecta TaxID=1367422 RepID=A0A178ZPU1_9EURO|nr:hypothetical protein AYL99_03414 [Fonsecaea erecta]OAP61213.1 hypothetical protein AYL99_03414 [Fonsecaea erecta]